MNDPTSSIDSQTSEVKRVAVVTGASSGIGRATAVRLAKDYPVMILHARRNREGLAQTAKQIHTSIEDTEIHMLLADFESPQQQDQFCDAIWQRTGRVDALVNNAGVDVLTGPAGKHPFEEKLQQVLQIDLISTMRLSRDVGQQMVSQGSGCIVNIGWDQAEHGMEGDSGEMFAASKGAVMAFSRSLAKSLAPHVRVNCVAPGWIQTAWGEDTSDYWKDRAQRESLLQSWGTPDDVAAMIQFLVSPSARFINGQVLPVNGGFNHGGQPMSKDSVPRNAR